jgi:hypothetical protein
VAYFTGYFSSYFDTGAESGGSPVSGRRYVFRPYPIRQRIYWSQPEAVVVEEPEVATEQPSGGWGWRNQAVIDRLQRKREEEEDLADRLEVELAKEGLVPPNPAAEVRIQVREYPPMKRRTQRAVDYALKARTELAYQLALREIAREQEEEEYALLLALAAA